MSIAKKLTELASLANIKCKYKSGNFSFFHSFMHITNLVTHVHWTMTITITVTLAMLDF